MKLSFEDGPNPEDVAFGNAKIGIEPPYNLDEVEYEEYLEKMKTKEVITLENITGRTFSFSDPDQNKSTDVSIVRVNRLLGKGSYGWVAEVEVALTNEKDPQKHIHKMALKKYYETRDSLESLKRSYNNYRMLKKAEIPTWDTYRINEEDRMVLMSLGTTEEEFLVTLNDDEEKHSGLAHLRKNPVKDIENMEEFFDQLKSILGKLKSNVYRLHADAWGFSFKENLDKPGLYKVRALVADLDGVDDSNNDFVRKVYGFRLEKNFERENREYLGVNLKNVFPEFFEKIKE